MGNCWNSVVQEEVQSSIYSRSKHQNTTTQPTNMKWILALMSVALTLFVLTQGKALKKLKDVPPDAECLLCVDDIMEAIDHCSNNRTQTLPWNASNMPWEQLPTVSAAFAT